jgi:hypothetical protein
MIRPLVDAYAEKTLEAGTPKKLDQSELWTLIRWLDLIVTATSSRILDDVGASLVVSLGLDDEEQSETLP